MLGSLGSGEFSASFSSFAPSLSARSLSKLVAPQSLGHPADFTEHWMSWNSKVAV